MPRPPRLRIADYPQHVTQRGINRQNCFFSEDDYRFYLRLLSASCKKNKCELHAYVLMTNHVHLLLTPRTAEGISLALRDLGREYVQFINKKYGRSGTMWEGRFRSSMVDRDFYSLACYRYIELNPVRAGLAQHPADYAWSSYRCNALGEFSSLITPHDSWLELGIDEEGRKCAYRDLFDDALEQSELADIRYGIGKGLPTGGDSFRSMIEEALAIKLRCGRVGRPPRNQA